MAKTVEQTAGKVSANAMPTTQDITQGGNVVAKSLQAGDKLATDMLKILGQGAEVRQNHNENYYRAMDAVIETTRREFDEKERYIAAGLGMAEKGIENQKLLDAFSGRWQFMKEILANYADKNRKK